MGSGYGSTLSNASNRIKKNGRNPVGHNLEFRLATGDRDSAGQRRKKILRFYQISFFMLKSTSFSQ